MVKMNIKLPKYCVRIKRNGYDDIYFTPKANIRPSGWPASIFLGRYNDETITKIREKAKSYLIEFNIARSGLSNNEYQEGSLPDIIARYKESEYWENKTARTCKEYDRYFTHIFDWSAKNNHAHISKLTAQALSKYLSQYKNTPKRRKEFKSIFSQILNFALTEGVVERNIAIDIKLPKSNKEKRKKILWLESDMDKFVWECDQRGLHSLASIAMTMIETAQRQNDVIKMVNGRDYKDGSLKYIQSKTGAVVQMRCTEKLLKRYEKYPPNDYMMFVHENTGKPWHPHNLSHTARKILDSLGMYGYILKDLRPSQVTYLLSLNCTANEIASITGHTLQTVRSMIDNHYGETRLPALADKVITKIDDERKKLTNLDNKKLTTNRNKS